MVFSSNVFLFVFLPLTLGAYYLTPRRGRNLCLLAASLIFYGWGEPRYLAIMIFVVLLNYAGGLVLAPLRSRRSGRFALALVIAANLAVLFYFKYTAFFLRSLNELFLLSPALRIPKIALPIGISFYIFQSMSYSIDVYRGVVAPQRSPIKFGAYVSMFPQLIAGPVVRYRDIAQQLEERQENLKQIASGVEIFIIGLGKKVLLANQVGQLWQALLGESGTLAAWVGMAAYTLQIYFDFSGYSDMAIGLGRMLGFEFLKNFDYPYISRSVTEFWRRWHISLSSWFREYVYIPLGGNRKGLARQIFNLLVVWALTGLWHGASWNFVLWGLYYALLLIAEKLFLLRAAEKLPIWLRRIGVLLAVSLGWMLFYFEDGSALCAFLSRLVRFAPLSAHTADQILGYLPILLVASLAATPLGRRAGEALSSRRWAGILRLCALLAVFLLCAAELASQSYNPFIYFRF